jgi:transposase
VVQDRNAPQKHVWRPEIVLLTADGVGTNEIMRRTAKSKTCVWRWQERFLEDGFDGLLRDKARPTSLSRLTRFPSADTQQTSYRRAHIGSR